MKRYGRLFSWRPAHACPRMTAVVIAVVLALAGGATAANAYLVAPAQIWTVAGDGGAADSGDGGPASGAA